MKLAAFVLLTFVGGAVHGQSHTVTIKSALNGGSNCIGLPKGVATENGTKVVTQPCDNSEAQQWSIYYSGAAYAQIRLADPKLNFCLDAINIRTPNKAEVWECNQTPRQQWNYTYGGFISLVRNRGLCLEVPNSKKDTPVQTNPCNGGLHQKWHFEFPN
ncbi:MAG: ricin B lectin domain-containing protein [Podila humilis]|nr:MAG: ricin B lectin domain-containing protein [Podila humilis]